MARWSGPGTDRGVAPPILTAVRLPSVLVGLVALLAATGSACSGGGHKALPGPVPPPEPTTAAVDYSGIGLPGVPGRTTTTVDDGPGQATLQGHVLGPDGPVPGATVEVERLVDDAVLTRTVATAADAGWTVAGVKGGRYRVRAWRPPDLAQVTPVIFFLGGNEVRRLDLTLDRYTGTGVAATIAPSPPPLDGPSNLAVQVRTSIVDGQGVVRTTPVPAVSVELVGGGGWSVESANPQTSDDGGVVRWRLVCSAPGASGLSVVVGGAQTYPVNVAPCAEPPPPPTTAPEGTTTTEPGATTTTTG